MATLYKWPTVFGCNKNAFIVSLCYTICANINQNESKW